MGEASLSLVSVLSVAAPVTTVDPATVATPGPNGAADPFAALLSTLVTGGATGTIPTPAVPAATAVPAMPTAILPSAGVPSAETSDLTPPTSDGDADDDKTADPLADAIAQGLTAVLALAQPAPPPPPPPVPVTVAVSTPASSAIAAVAAPIVASVLPPAAAVPTTDADTPPVAADGAAQPAPGAADATPSPAAKPTPPPPADYSPAVIMTLRAAVETARPAEAAVAAVATPPAATADQPPAPVEEAAAAVASSAPRPPVRAPRTPGLAGRVEAAATPQRAARTDMRRLAETAQPAALAAAFADRAQAPLAADPNAAAPAAPADVAFQQQLNVAQDGQWLDSLARDIAMSAGSGNDLHFKLNPPNLGALTVQIAQAADGASIRLTTDSTITHTMLIDAQPRLVAEARAQGLKVSDTNVDLSQQHSGGGASMMRQGDGSAGQNGQNRQPLPDHQPFSRSTGTNNQSVESEADSDALYA